jgi:Holliday junction resolvase-like predicted endonuclease
MKFRTKYDMRSKKDTKLLSNAIWRPRAKDYKDVIEDYIEISKKRHHNKLAISKLQMHLLEDVITHQKILDAYNKKLAEFKKCSILNKNNIKYVKEEIFVNELVIRNLRDIADGIAWRFFEYNRGLLQYLGDKPEKGPFRTHEGLFNELRVWSEAFDSGKSVSLINDLTNVIRIGDITIFHDNSEIEFVEVKSSKTIRGKERKARLIRQKNRLEETARFFNTGKTTLDDHVISLHKIPIVPKTNFDSLKATIEKAKNTGAAHAEIEDYLIIECVDFETKKPVEHHINYFENNSRSISKKWREKGDILLGPRYFHERLDFSHNLAPLSTWPIDSGSCANLMMGRIMVAVIINVSEIQRKFQRQGWTIEKSLFDSKKIPDKTEKVTSLITLRKGPFIIEVPPGILARVFYEFLSPDTLLETFSWFHENTPKWKEDIALISYEEEHKLWI